jgi:hypothetical protein
MRRTLVRPLVVSLAALAIACANPFAGRGTTKTVADPEPAAAPEPPPVAPSAPVATPVSPAPPAAPECAAARAAREDVRARLASLRLTVGVEEARRFDGATAAQAACMSDEACARDGETLLERFTAVKDAEAAMERARAQLSAEEIGLYTADRSVAAACGPE